MFGLIPTGLRRKRQIAEGNYVSRSNQPQMKADRHGFKQTEFTGRLNGFIREYPVNSFTGNSAPDFHGCSLMNELDSQRENSLCLNG